MEARDGTTNALSLPDPEIFAPLYGPGSAERFRAHAPFATARIPELENDVDTAEPTSSDSLRSSARGRARCSPFTREGRPALRRRRRSPLRTRPPRRARAGELTVIGNVGDDLEILGLHVSPDLDGLLYALAGLVDDERGWGRADETWNALASAASWGGPEWFRLGDLDIGLHLVRTGAARRRRALLAA